MGEGRPTTTRDLVMAESLSVKANRELLGVCGAEHVSSEVTYQGLRDDR